MPIAITEEEFSSVVIEFERNLFVCLITLTIVTNRCIMVKPQHFKTLGRHDTEV